MTSSFLWIEVPETNFRVRLEYNSAVLTEEEAEDSLVEFMEVNEGIIFPRDFEKLKNILGWGVNNPKPNA
jgi:hypothetical protein